MCPAVMLAASRIPSVTGRIITLTLSTNLMNGSSKIGVFLGTK